MIPLPMKKQINTHQKPEEIALSQTIAALIYQCKRDHNLTSKQVAKRLSISPKTLYNWENGLTLAQKCCHKRIFHMLNI